MLHMTHWNITSHPLAHTGWHYKWVKEGWLGHTVNYASRSEIKEVRRFCETRLVAGSWRFSAPAQVENQIYYVGRNYTYNANCFIMWFMDEGDRLLVCEFLDSLPPREGVFRLIRELDKDTLKLLKDHNYHVFLLPWHYDETTLGFFSIREKDSPVMLELLLRGYVEACDLENLAQERSAVR